MKCQSKNLKTISSVERLNNHVSKSYNSQSEDSITMSVINLNIQQPTKKSNFIFYSDREYERFFGWKKQHEADKREAVYFTNVVLFTEKQKPLSVEQLESIITNYTNCDMLALKYLLSSNLIAEKNNKPLQVKNETIANQVGCSVYSYQKAKKKFFKDKLFVSKQSNKFAVPVYVCLLDKKTRGILYNLLSRTVPHILNIKEPNKALKKSPYKKSREAARAEKLGYPQIHNLVDTDIIKNLFINNISSLSITNNLKSNIYPTSNTVVLDNDNCKMVTLCQKSSKLNENLAENLVENVTFFKDVNFTEKNDIDKKIYYNKNSFIKGKENNKMDLRTYQKEILKRLNPEFVQNLKKEFDSKPESNQKSTELHDLSLRIKLIDQAKKMHHKPSLFDCDGNQDTFRVKNDEYLKLVRDSIKKLYSENGIDGQETKTIYS